MAATPALSIFLLVVVLAMSTQESSAAAGSSWCVCKPELPAAALQSTLDYACGHGADCAPLLPGGQCHSGTDTVAARCSYAANSYYNKANGRGDATCDFGGTATLTSKDPSSGTCRYPATAASASSPAGDGAGAPRELWPFLLAIVAIFVSVVWRCTSNDMCHDSSYQLYPGL